ncbi:MAG TPA: hypothetical protein VJP77_07140 [Planctomycetota bacterium]|nr:hypothetical protein [Planctomycetota bacterium]
MVVPESGAPRAAADDVERPAARLFPAPARQRLASSFPRPMKIVLQLTSAFRGASQPDPSAWIGIRGERVPCLVEAEPDAGLSNGLKALLPHVERFLTPGRSESVRFYRATEQIRSELAHARLQAVAPSWAAPLLSSSQRAEGSQAVVRFGITDIQAVRFPTAIFALWIEVEPDPAAFDSDPLVVAKVLASVLSRSTPRTDSEVGLRRSFGDPRQEASARERFGVDQDHELARLLVGEVASIGGLAISLVDPSLTPMLPNRQLTHCLLVTDWDGRSPAFDSADYQDLLRLARGESDRYVPSTAECSPEAGSIATTFENIAFGFASEGAACWVKAKLDQDFLKSEFPYRFRSTYSMLFLLAIHQRFALADVADRMDERSLEATRYLERREGGVGSTPSPSAVGTADGGAELEHLANLSAGLNELRSDVARLQLRAFFQQPAHLTAHQRYYDGLQRVFRIGSLFDESRTSVQELDFLIARLHRLRTEALERQDEAERAKDRLAVLTSLRDTARNQERSQHVELMLTLVVEFVAIQYYSYYLLDKAFDHNSELAFALSATGALLAVAITAWRLKYAKLAFLLAGVIVAAAAGKVLTAGWQAGSEEASPGGAEASGH